MGGLYSRKKSRAKNKTTHRAHKTKHIGKFQDQVHDDIQPENQKKFENLPVDEDLPGLGQFYCISCARYFVNKVALDDHVKTKVHKKNQKRAEEQPYTIKDSEEYAKR